jgi:hypothetical protein
MPPLPSFWLRQGSDDGAVCKVITGYVWVFLISEKMSWYWLYI